MQRHLIKLVLAVLLWPSFVCAQESGKIFQEEDPYKLVFAGGIGQFTEGVAVASDGKVYFSDILIRNYEAGYTGLIWRYDPEVGKTEVFRSPSGSSVGLAFDSKGRLVVCEADNQGGQRITRTDMQTGITKVVTWEFEGRRYNSPNDLVIDKLGNIYFTDPKMLGIEPMNQPVHGVYKVDTSGVVSLVIANIRKPNGIAISPDQTTLYISTADNTFNGDVSENYQGDRTDFSGKLLAYSIKEDGGITYEKELADFGKGIGDGMTVDSEGNIYVSLFLDTKIAVYSPEGDLIDEHRFPKWVTNVSFGRGSYKSTLFVTGIEGLYEVETSKEGFHIPFEEQPPMQEVTMISMKNKELDRYTGEYKIDERFSVKIFREGERLYGQGTGQSKFEIFPYEKNKFFTKVSDMKMHFNVSSTGDITDFDILQDGDSSKFIKQTAEQGK